MNPSPSDVGRTVSTHAGPGTLVAVGGGRTRAVGRGRAKVRLVSGAYLSLPLSAVALIPKETT